MCIVAKHSCKVEQSETSTISNEMRKKSEVLLKKRFRQNLTNEKSVKKTWRAKTGKTGPKGFDPLTTGLEVQHSIHAELQAQVSGNWYPY